MMIYFIESTFCMGLLYGFYHFFLRNHKILLFNRSYLILSVIISILIPLIDIPIDSKLPFNSVINSITTNTVNFIQGESIPVNSSSQITFQNILVALFISISTCLFIRFVINIYRLTQKIVKNKKVNYHKISLVLVEEKVIPHSFLRYVFIHKSDFEDGRIEKELLIHEEAHCMQYHSIDVILIQLLTIIFWFNPLIWLFKNSILLNHEYLADNKALSGEDLNNYQHILLKILLHNNSNILVSGFKNSFIKNRLDMMTKSFPNNNAILRKLSAISLIIILAITFSCSKENPNTGNLSNFEIDWWSPILKKHNITPSASNNFEKVFEMGTTNSITNRIVTLENALFLLKPDGDEYTIIRSPKAFHDLDKNIIEAEEGTIESYSLKSKEINPFRKFTFSYLKYQVADQKVVVKNINIIVNNTIQNQDK